LNRFSYLLCLLLDEVFMYWITYVMSESFYKVSHVTLVGIQID